MGIPCGIFCHFHLRFFTAIVIPGNTKITIRFSIAQQKDPVCGVITAFGFFPSRKALAFAVIHCCLRNAFQLLRGKCCLQKFTVQPFSQGAVLPCDLFISCVVWQMIQSVSTQEQCFPVLYVQHNPLYGLRPICFISVLFVMAESDNTADHIRRYRLSFCLSNTD